MEYLRWILLAAGLFFVLIIFLRQVNNKKIEGDISFIGEQCK